MNLFTKSTSKVDRTQIKSIKSWVYQILEINMDIPISINQLQCHEPDCPPIETVIAIMDNPPKQYKIHKAASEITESDIAALIAV